MALMWHRRNVGLDNNDEEGVHAIDSNTDYYFTLFVCSFIVDIKTMQPVSLIALQ